MTHSLMQNAKTPPLMTSPTRNP